MHSAFGGKLVGLGTAGVYFSEKINKLSQGDIDIKFLDSARRSWRNTASPPSCSPPATSIRRSSSARWTRTEFSNPAIDLNLGFHQIAKHYYFPGWHQQATFVELQVNLDKWKAITDHRRLLIETACDAALHYTIGSSEAAQADALGEIARKGVTLHRWPPETLKKFEADWQSVIAEESAKDANFKKIADSLYAFRKKYAVWKDLGFINRTPVGMIDPQGPAFWPALLFSAADP